MTTPAEAGNPDLPYGWAPLVADRIPPAPALVTPGRRVVAGLLDLLLFVVTLGVGWLGWAMFTWPAGQTPAKRLLGHVVADGVTGLPFGRKRMAVREMCLKVALNVVTLTAFAWIDCFFVFSEQHRTLHDRISNSVVVER
ncbi:RDD family protein [Actinoplanes sp. NPDC023714]|uniref:RDD family protein n=1 Tax=Actinoplanes sp. NPDC023714 TaxID=3154322 RepID=UPI0033CEA77E